MKKLSVICLLVAGIILISGCIDGEKTNSKTSTSSQSSINETSASPSISISLPSDNYSSAELLIFIERMFTYPRIMNLSLLPGELPSDLPVMVPIPEDAVVIGSSVYSDKYQQIQIILDVPKDPSEILDFYKNNLEKAGWNESEGFYPEERGFTSFYMPEMTIFCRFEGEGPSLTITSYASNGDGPTDVRLNLDTDPRNPICSILSERSQGISRAEDVIPILKPPKGAQPKGGGGGGGDDQYNSEATLETELSVLELEDHYQNQLVEAGWELEENVSNSSITLSTWSFTDEIGDQWSGILFVNEVGKSDLYFVYFTVQLVY
ncbi:MAG: hypothetical protein E4G94_08525 [ANME-2 cluster archaeon]|nr:MAG: hypothetical protein E4G94_08525 [ANME-2 cluster archaeon]HUV83487.1 hypothetical protein [archaeon]